MRVKTSSFFELPACSCVSVTFAGIIVNEHNRRVKEWEIIADHLSKAGWSWGCVSKRFVVRADEKLTAFLKLKSANPSTTISSSPYSFTHTGEPARRLPLQRLCFSCRAELLQTI
jgi:hypothetical protein